MIQHLTYNTLCSSQQMHSLIPITYFTHPHTHLPSGNYQFSRVKSLFLGLLCSFFSLLVLFLKFHIWVKSYGICLSLTGLFHLVLYCLDPSMSLQMAKFHYFLWLNNIPLCMYIMYAYYVYTYIYNTSFVSIHSSINGYWAASIIWLL